MREPSQGRYGRVAILLHWSIAALVVANLLIGQGFELFEAIDRGAWVRLHKSIGITVLLLSFARLGWRLMHPPAPSLLPARERRLAGAVHVAFYALLILMPLSGWIMVSLADPLRTTLLWGLVEWPAIEALAQQPAGPKAALHEISAIAHTSVSVLMTALVALHIAATLRHTWRKEPGGVSAMLRPRR